MEVISHKKMHLKAGRSINAQPFSSTLKTVKKSNSQATARVSDLRMSSRKEGGKMREKKEV
jgi:hypothetical protein